jgi:hypothetical protein
MALGSTQPLTKMSTRNLPGVKKWPAYRADSLAAICELMSENVGASTSRNPKGLHGLYRDNFTLPHNNSIYNFSPLFKMFPQRIIRCSVTKSANEKFPHISRLHFSIFLKKKKFRIILYSLRYGQNICIHVNAHSDWITEHENTTQMI